MSDESKRARQHARFMRGTNDPLPAEHLSPQQESLTRKQRMEAGTTPHPADWRPVHSEAGALVAYRCPCGQVAPAPARGPATPPDTRLARMLAERPHAFSELLPAASMLVTATTGAGRVRELRRKIREARADGWLVLQQGSYQLRGWTPPTFEVYLDLQRDVQAARLSVAHWEAICASAGARKSATKTLAKRRAALSVLIALYRAAWDKAHPEQAAPPPEPPPAPPEAPKPRRKRAAKAAL